MKTLLAFDNDGVLRNEYFSYRRCIVETVAFFDGRPVTEKEMTDSLKQNNNDWERTHNILKQRGRYIIFETVKEHFQDLYLGSRRNFSGYINDEPWLADNVLLKQLARKYNMVIISGAPSEEVRYTLKKNNALGFFSGIWGMHECERKNEGIERAIIRFRAERTFFCDDRPSPIRDVLTSIYKITAYGIMPPNAPNGWEKKLKDAGAVEVYKNVNDYCRFLINTGPKQ